jgi:hypothetical protein
MQMPTQDFHLLDVQSRIQARDEAVKAEVFSIETCNYLKLFKWNIQPNSLLCYNPSVYTLVQRIDQASVKILLVTYNEEVLEDLVVEVEDRKSIDDSLVAHICNSLNRQFRLCPGIETPADLANSEEINRILIEKYGDNIIFRSRGCAR